MSRILIVPIQGDGPCIHRVTWGRLCLINLKEVIGHLNHGKGRKEPLPWEGLLATSDEDLVGDIGYIRVKVVVLEYSTEETDRDFP